MTAAARRVLADCKAALEMLEDERRWRVGWVGALALLRAVGHVLRNVDGRTPRAQAAINAAYDSWKAKPEHLVFREFIERERNNILKEYRLSVLDSAEAHVAVVVGDSDAVCGANETPLVLDENLFRPVTEGFGAGEDARDVYRESEVSFDGRLRRTPVTLSPWSYQVSSSWEPDRDSEQTDCQISRSRGNERVAALDDLIQSQMRLHQRAFLRFLAISAVLALRSRACPVRISFSVQGRHRRVWLLSMM